MSAARATEKPVAVEKAPPRLLARYRSEMVPALMQRFQYKNPFQAPRVRKVVVNMGVGAATQDPKHLDAAVAELALITGQHPIVTRAKKSISNFKIKRGQAIGCKVTLRGPRMYEFLDRLLCVAMPRIRDFRGVSPTAFDAQGNYTMGISEQVIFPEIDPDKVSRAQGMDVTICMTAKSRDEAHALLQHLGMPFQRQG